MEINFINNSNESSWRAYKQYLQPLLRRTLEAVKHDENVVVNVVLVNDEEIHEYNRNFRNVDRPTDVLSFIDGDVDEGQLLMGDIIISIDALRRQAKDYGHTLKREFCFLVVHGYLHLLGYDHHTENEEKEMFGLQFEILKEIAPKHG